VTRRLWFGLAAAVRLSEHTLSRTVFDRHLPGTPAAPCLLLALDPQPRLIGNGLPALRAGNHIDPVHVDVLTEPAPPRQQTAPAGRHLLPLTGLLPGLLRTGLAAGHCWFVIDVTGRGQPLTRTWTAREVDEVPDTAERINATVTAGRLGPYPARVARGYLHAGAAIAWFDLHTCGRLADDTQTVAGGPDGLPVVRVVGDTVWLDPAPATAGQASIPVAREPGGWYRITHPALRWTAHPSDDLDAQDAPLFETWGPDGTSLRCTVCGAVDDIDHQELPSMAGYGYDTCTTCTLCGSAEISDPIFGLRVHRAAWPPDLKRRAPA